MRYAFSWFYRNFCSTYPTFLAGHVLCLSCCNKILDTITSQPVPAWPFCREPFSHDAVRLIRIDSNRVTPQQVHPQRDSKGECPTIFPLFTLFLFYYFPHHIHALRTPQELTVAAIVAPASLEYSEVCISARTMLSPQWVGPPCSLARSHTSRVGPHPRPCPRRRPSPSLDSSRIQAFILAFVCPRLSPRISCRSTSARAPHMTWWALRPPSCRAPRYSRYCTSTLGS
jgi:hypothetical protein